MFEHDRSFEMKALEALMFSLRKLKMHMSTNITNFNENYSTDTIIASLIE